MIDIQLDIGNYCEMMHRALPLRDPIAKPSRRARAPWIHAAVAIAIAAGAGSGCLAILGDFEPPSGEAGSTSASAASGSVTSTSGSSGNGSAVSSGGGGDTSASSAGAGGAGGTAGAGGNEGCPSGPGPLMIAVPDLNGGEYCIDSTEVTIHQYNDWLLNGAKPASDQPPECSFNTDHTPKKGGGCDLFLFDELAAQMSALPIACVNWCDAYAYCAWAGKRLCGKIGGGPSDFNSPADPSTNQWHRACSKDGVNKYSYGNTHDPTKCIGNDHDGVAGYNTMTDVPHEVPTLTCEGGYPGLYDMSGNIAEWEDACDGFNNCLVRGGSDENDPPSLECAVTFGSQRSAARNERGFRCCTD